MPTGENQPQASITAICSWDMPLLQSPTRAASLSSMEGACQGDLPTRCRTDRYGFLDKKVKQLLASQVQQVKYDSQRNVHQYSKVTVCAFKHFLILRKSGNIHSWKDACEFEKQELKRMHFTRE